MRKYIIPIICIILLTGCTKIEKQEIKTITKNDDSYVSINYPVTGIKILDTKIEEYINYIYSDFEKTYSNAIAPELNITYTFNKVDEKYISVSLNSFINDGSNKTNSIATFNYDKSNKKFIDTNDLVDTDKLNYIVKKEIAENFKKCDINCLTSMKVSDFTIDDKNMTLYFNPKDLNSSEDEIVSIEIPLSDLNLALKTNEKIKEMIKYNTTKRAINIKNKVVALTFDDGPSKHTEKILNTLKKENARATFFIVGNKASFYQSTLLKMVAGGNEIGNHSYSHKLLTRLSNEEFKKEIDKTQEVIFETTGYISKLIRPTYGGYSDKLMSNTDLKLTLWDVDSSDWRYKSERKIVNNVLNYVEDGDIILMHDTFARTASSVEKIIKELKNDGFVFVTVSELNDIKKQRNK